MFPCGRYLHLNLFIVMVNHPIRIRSSAVSIHFPGTFSSSYFKCQGMGQCSFSLERLRYLVRRSVFCKHEHRVDIGSPLFPLFHPLLATWIGCSCRRPTGKRAPLSGRSDGTWPWPQKKEGSQVFQSSVTKGLEKKSEIDSFVVQVRSHRRRWCQIWW